MSSSSDSSEPDCDDGDDLLSLNGDGESVIDKPKVSFQKEKQQSSPSSNSEEGENDEEENGRGDDDELLSINGDPETKDNDEGEKESSSDSDDVDEGVDEEELLSIVGDTEQGLSSNSNQSKSTEIESGSDDDELLSLSGGEDTSATTAPRRSGVDETTRVNGNQGRNGSAEVTLSDDEDSGAEVPSTSSASRASSSQSQRYGLRRKRTINYAEVDNGPDLPGADGDGTRPSKKSKRDIFDIFSLSIPKIERIMKNPNLIDAHTSCKINFFHGTDSTMLEKVTNFFERCGKQFEHIFISTRNTPDVYPFLKGAFKTTRILTKVDYRYNNNEDAFQFLNLIKNLRSKNYLPMLGSLKLVSLFSAECLTERHVALLADIPSQFTSLELGDALWEDVKVETIERLLSKHTSSLETLIIHGGFKGSTESDKDDQRMITFPRMESLKSLCICPVYGFVSEIKNPYSKKQRVISLGPEQEEPLKATVTFPLNGFPKLERLILGNLISIEDLQFSTIRKLQEFKCGSYWNLNITFPPDSSRKNLLESTVTELQLPDALKDPYFPIRVAKHFPYVRKIHINLPSVPVLRAFFKAFENSKLEALYLKTQFDFDSTLESCLLPRMSDVLRKSSGTETILRTLKEYKHFDEYVKYYNVELPVEQEDLMETHSAGIATVKNLKILHLEHIPRKLLIPIPDDERKWYDHHCKFMSTTFGYIHYPLKQQCHKEILKMDLDEYIWKNIDISQEFTEEFHQAGFVDITEEQVIDMETDNLNNSFTQTEEEELFIPIQRRNMQKGTHVKIMPSMLAPVFKSKTESA